MQVAGARMWVYRSNVHVDTSSVPPSDLPLNDHLEKLLALERALNGRGIPTANTRIRRYATYLEAGIAGRVDPAEVFKNSKAGPFNSPADWFLYVIREVHELAWITEGLLPSPPIGLDGKLKSIVGGRDFAVLDKDSESRNTQFELRIASYMSRAGCSVDLATLTDIVARTQHDAFYIECKRVGSASQLQKRLNEASEQLLQRMPSSVESPYRSGWIAVDVTKIAFPHNGITIGARRDDVTRLLREKIAEIGSALDTARLFDENEALLGCWFQIHIPSALLFSRSFETRFCSLHVGRAPSNRASADAQARFYELLEGVSQPKVPTPIPIGSHIDKEVVLPAGSMFWLDPGAIEIALRSDEPTNATDPLSTIGKLKIAEREYVFLRFELNGLPPSIVAAVSSAEDPEVALICYLYAQRTIE